MDQLSVKLNASNIGGDIGGDIGGVLVNHLCYADDICLISLSSAGMQQLFVILMLKSMTYCIMVVNLIPYVLNPNVLYLINLFLH